MQAKSWRASFRGDRDRDFGGQDAEGEGAEQHRLYLQGGFSDGRAGELSGSVRLDVTGAHQHHQLDHLIHLVVHLEQVEFGDATGIEELPRGDWWIFSPSYSDRIHRMMHPEVAIAWFCCVCAGAEIGACV